MRPYRGAIVGTAAALGCNKIRGRDSSPTQRDGAGHGFFNMPLVVASPRADGRYGLEPKLAIGGSLHEGHGALLVWRQARRHLEDRVIKVDRRRRRGKSMHIP